MNYLMEDVAAFHKACDVPVSTTPHILSQDREDLRVKLIAEEINSELIPAMRAGNLVEIADGIADAIYVLVGAALEYGIPLDQVWQEVHSANMKKVDPDTGKVTKRSDGKILKPLGWKPPNIKSALMMPTMAGI